jgi:hypothetical protein
MPRIGDKHTRVFSSAKKKRLGKLDFEGLDLHGRIFTRRFLNLFDGLLALINFDG